MLLSAFTAAGELAPDSSSSTVIAIPGVVGWLGVSSIPSTSTISSTTGGTACDSGELELVFNDWDRMNELRCCSWRRLPPPLAGSTEHLDTFACSPHTES